MGAFSLIVVINLLNSLYLMAFALYKPPRELSVAEYLACYKDFNHTSCPPAFQCLQSVDFFGSPRDLVESLGLFRTGQYRIDYSELRIAPPIGGVFHQCVLSSSHPAWKSSIAYGSTQQGALNASCALLIAAFWKNINLATTLLKKYMNSWNTNFKLFCQPVPIIPCQFERPNMFYQSLTPRTHPLTFTESQSEGFRQSSDVCNSDFFSDQRHSLNQNKSTRPSRFSAEPTKTYKQSSELAGELNNKRKQVEVVHGTIKRPDAQSDKELSSNKEIEDDEV